MASAKPVKHGTRKEKMDVPLPVNGNA